MKPSLILPLVTALAGFGLGWLAKPATDSACATSPAAIAPHKTPEKPAPAAVAPRENPAAPAQIVRKAAPNAAGAGSAGGAADVTSPKDAAKMLRLVEALGLSDAQQADLKKLIAGSQRVFLEGYPEVAGPNEILDHIAASGAALEKSLAALFTPEQSATFEDLRNRERSNRIETTAQRELADLTEVTDLTAEQREQALAELRKTSAGELGAIPASLALVLDSSVLPLGPEAPPARAIQTLRQLVANQTSAEPAAQHAKLIETQRRQLDERLKLFKDILTPAQLAQYQAAIAEQRAIQEAMLPPQK
jgi:hypothetical protein